ncbi:MAG: DUF2058 family protein [Pseudobacteriovorax sp.]|nr:DUF2058 family protein [Pseudobacteriovorax sp.]
MSLRDQLLKQGLASKQQAKKAARAAKKKKHEQTKQGKQNTPDEIQQKIAKDREAQKERDRQLNKENQRLQQTMQAVHLIFSEGQLTRDSGREAYFFLTEDKKLHHIYVDPKQRDMLSDGRLGVATLLDDRYYLLSKDGCLLVRDLFPELLLCLHI